MLIACTNLENILLKYYTAFQITLTKLEFTTFFTSDNRIRTTVIIKKTKFNHPLALARMSFGIQNAELSINSCFDNNVDVITVASDSAPRRR